MAATPAVPSANLTNGGMTKGGMNLVSEVIPISRLSPQRLRTCTSKAIARPQRARLKCREQLCRQVGRKAAATHHRCERLHVSRRTQTTEQTTLGCNQRRLDLVAKPLSQHAAQIPDGVGKAKFNRSAASPIFSRKQGIFGTGQARATARFHQRDEIIVDFLLDSLQTRHVVRVL